MYIGIGTIVLIVIIVLIILLLRGAFDELVSLVRREVAIPAAGGGQAHRCDGGTSVCVGRGLPAHAGPGPES